MQNQIKFMRFSCPALFHLGNGGHQMLYVFAVYDNGLARHGDCGRYKIRGIKNYPPAGNAMQLPQTLPENTKRRVFFGEAANFLPVWHRLFFHAERNRLHFEAALWGC